MCHCGTHRPMFESGEQTLKGTGTEHWENSASFQAKFPEKAFSFTVTCILLKSGGREKNYGVSNKVTDGPKLRLFLGSFLRVIVIDALVLANYPDLIHETLRF